MVNDNTFLIRLRRKCPVRAPALGVYSHPPSPRTATSPIRFTEHVDIPSCALQRRVLDLTLSQNTAIHANFCTLFPCKDT
ncbi:hypothetical protein PsYK624_067640 [Phanerochaete sordida]|uniref:Uncharacterized protein n=1 Tax=Phanerochaete sordida TaxID=48140 RepID=A0A9P3G9V9_9APHY|nr:hypothetical protein PsYK624_067640 [Phanerochaete sordida]